MDTKVTTQQCYEEYHRTKATNRNDLLTNPEVLYQALAFEASIIRALGAINVTPRTAKVLDVGCGGGGSLLTYLKLGFFAENLFGIDILEDRIRSGKLQLPNLNLSTGDATQLEFSDDTFDITFESTMFLQLTDEDLAKQIGSEMIRVTKPGGHIILADWRYGKLGKSEFSAVNRKRISRLFALEKSTCLVAVYNGALIPPIGRFLSSNMPAAYFVIKSLFPLLVGQTTTVLQKL